MKHFYRAQTLELGKVRTWGYHTKLYWANSSLQHSSEIVSLCQKKSFGKTLQNLPYFWNLKTGIILSFCVVFITQWFNAIAKKRKTTKNIRKFHVPKIWQNLMYYSFRKHGISSSTNLLFRKIHKFIASGFDLILILLNFKCNFFSFSDTSFCSSFLKFTIFAFARLS